MAITIVAYAIYFRRYYRRDLLLAYFALNVGVFAVTAVLADSTAGVGLGLGLFGILSIIRLRSDSITQEEIAYYFVALALGLIAGLAANPSVARPGAVGSARGRHVRRRPSSAHCPQPAAEHHPGPCLPRSRAARGGPRAPARRGVRHLVVLQLDLVADTTMVDVRFKVPRAAHAQLEACRARAAANGRDRVSAELATERERRTTTRPALIARSRVTWTAGSP